nr:hypothetical protein [Kibdelosporangium sp. MJ126-NF4]CTQ98077.1 hypothetical protein [Kibdelosporangium sp. MJ126-NF4]
MLDEWLGELRRRRWVHMYFPTRESPKVHASLFQHAGGIVDVAAIFDSATAVAYRAPIPQGGDPFDPLQVTWVFAGEPVWAVRGALALPAPGSPGEPHHLLPPPPLVRGLAELTGLST